MNGRKLMITSPIYNSAHPGFMMSCFALGDALSAEGLPSAFQFRLGISDIATARSELISAFLNSDATDMLMVDSDITFSVDTVRRMLASGHDFIGAVYPLKMFNMNRAADAMRRGHFDAPQALAMEFCVNYWEIVEKAAAAGPDRIITVDRVGTGCLLVSRAAVERIYDAYPNTHYKYRHNEPLEAQSMRMFAPFDHLIVDGVRQGEDFSFCLRWTQLGGKVHILLDATLTHSGPGDYSGNLDQWAAALAKAGLQP